MTPHERATVHRTGEAALPRSTDVAGSEVYAEAWRALPQALVTVSSAGVPSRDRTR